jgi:hypothetical protein
MYLWPSEIRLTFFGVIYSSIFGIATELDSIRDSIVQYSEAPETHTLCLIITLLKKNLMLN